MTLQQKGLNRQQQIQCAQAIEDGIPPKLIAKKFRTAVAIVESFTKEAIAKVDKAARERTKYFNERKTESVETASVFKEVIRKMNEEAHKFVPAAEKKKVEIPGKGAKEGSVSGDTKKDLGLGK